MAGMGLDTARSWVGGNLFFLFSFTQCLDSTWTVTKKSRAISLIMSTSRGVIVEKRTKYWRFHES